MDAIICFALAAAFLIISIRQFEGKGFVFNNTYLYASKEDRESMDKKPYYRQSGIIFALLAAGLASMWVYCLTKIGWILRYVFVSTMAAAIVYACIASIRNDKE